MDINTILGPFIKNYNKFLEFFPTEINEQVVLIYGASRTGKSTLVGRTQTEANPEDFCELIVNEHNTVIEGVEIGPGVLSVTTVPKAFRCGQMTLIDMPGLFNTDTTRRSMISILQRCLFRKVKKVKFLIVASAMVLYNSPQTIVNDYYENLNILFDTRSKECLESCYFIFTHADRLSNDQRNGIRNFLQNLSFQATELNGWQSLFYRRATLNHFLVDYRRHGKADVVNAISEFYLKPNYITPEIFRVSVLDNQINEVNSRCNEFLRSEIDRINMLKAEIIRDILQQKGVAETLVARRAEAAKDLKENQESERTYAEGIKKTGESLRVYQDELFTLKENKAQIEAQRETSIKEIKSLEKYLGDSESFERIDFTSVERNKEHKIYASMNIESSTSFFSVASLSPIPIECKSEESARLLTSAQYIHNSLVGRTLFKIVKDTESKYVNVEVRHDAKCYLSIFFKVNLSKLNSISSFVKAISTQNTEFDQRIKKIVQYIAVKENGINTCTTRLKSDTASLETTKAKITELTTEIAHLDESIVSKKSAADALILDKVKLIEDICQNETSRNLREISQILEANGLEFSMSLPLIEYRRLLKSIIDEGKALHGRW